MIEEIADLRGKWQSPMSADPVDLALMASQVRRDDRGWLAEPGCLEIGRRLLLAELQFSDWVLRRVEKVQFERERSVAREISIDFGIRPDAPTFSGRDGKPMLLVPLSMMRRRTLVNLALLDEDEHRLPMLGLRLTQQLDEAILLAAAEAAKPGLGSNTDVIDFVKKAVGGTADEVDDAFTLFTGAADSPVFLPDLRKSDTFTGVFHRLHRNFTLYVLLEAGRTHRVLTLSFDEPTDWRLQRPVVNGVEVAHYRPMQKVPRVRKAWLQTTAQLGLRSTLIRFQTPGAENATSYHFEAAAPHGVRIVDASLLAARPNDSDHPVSWDRTVGLTPSVGLHAVEIPNVSLCRVQLKLRVPVRGWLATLVVSCFAIVCVLLSVAWHWGKVPPEWTDAQVTNVVLLLVTVSASAASLVAHRDFGGLAAAMVTRLRMVGVCSLAMPIVAAGSLVYAGKSPWPGGGRLLGNILWTLTGLAGLAFLLTVSAAFCSWFAERRSGAASPWDMTLPPGEIAGLTKKHRASVRKEKFADAVKDLQFDRPAIGINSAEGWHSVYGWTDTLQRELVGALESPVFGLGQPCGTADPCSRWATCPAHHSTTGLTSGPNAGASVARTGVNARTV